MDVYFLAALFACNHEFAIVAPHYFYFIFFVFERFRVLSQSYLTRLASFDLFTCTCITYEAYDRNDHTF
jgi:hypothetical protein